MPFATTAAVKLCVRIARRVATRPRVAIMAAASRPAVRIVRRVVAPMLVCTTVVPPSVVPPIETAPPPVVPPAVVTAPPYVPPYVLPPGAIIPPGMAWVQLPPSTTPVVPGNPVPEPSTAWLVLGALGALAIFRRPM